MPPEHDYLAATRHPWPCLLFLLPLLAAYEGGVLWLGGAHPELLRNGVDAWLRWGLECFGLSQLYGAPALVLGVLLFWSWTDWDDRPYDLSGVWLGMAIESVVFALGLWGLNRGLEPLLHRLGVVLSSAAPAGSAAARVVTYVGAGVYEEVLFRLVLFAGLVGVLQHLGAADLPAFLLAAGLSAGLFALAHHVGPYGEPFDGLVFLFRALAGLYFALLFQVRGFGVAVGAHACYDVLVGVGAV
jgi:hypothetical protein